MGRAPGALVALALVAASATAAVSQMAAPPGFAVAARSELAGGVEYLKVTKPGPVATQDAGPPTPPSNRTELIAGTQGPWGPLNHPVNVALGGIRTGAAPIPADGAVVAGDGGAAQQLLDAWAHKDKGMPPRGRVAV